MLKVSIGHTLLSISLLGTKGSYGQAGLKAVIKESIGHPLLSISPLGTKGRDGQCDELIDVLVIIVCDNVYYIS